MTILNIGVIGNGSISDVHFDAYHNNASARIYAVCDLNEERARAKATKYGAEKVFTDYRELLADPTIDAVSICTWNNSHAEIAIAAITAGKHVLSEKPLSRTMEEAYQIQEAVNSSDRVFQVGFVRRCAQNTKVLKQFIDAGDLGEIYCAKATCVRRLGNPGGWFADVERSGGGPLIDLGVHIIDISWYLMGKPKVKSITGNVYYKLGNRSNVNNYSFYKAADYDSAHNTVEDSANALIRFENGASMLVDVSYSLHAKEDEIAVKLYGTKGGAELEPELALALEQHNTIINVLPQIDHLTFDFQAAFQGEIDQFVDSCLNGTPSMAPVEDGVEIMRMLCGIYEAAETGHEVSFI